QDVMIQPALHGQAAVANVALPIERRGTDQQRTHHPRADRTLEWKIALIRKRQCLEDGPSRLTPNIAAFTDLDEVGRHTDVISHNELPPIGFRWRIRPAAACWGLGPGT